MHDTSWASGGHPRLLEEGSAQRQCRRSFTVKPAFWLARPHCGGRWSPPTVPHLASAAHHVAITAAIAPSPAVLEHSRASTVEQLPAESSSPRQQHSSTPARQEHQDRLGAAAQSQRQVNGSRISGAMDELGKLQSLAAAPLSPAQQQLLSAPEHDTQFTTPGQPQTPKEGVVPLQDAEEPREDGALPPQERWRRWPREDTLALLQGIAQHGTAWAAIQRECLPHLTLKRVTDKGQYIAKRASVEEIQAAMWLHGSGAGAGFSAGEHYVLQVLGAEEGHRGSGEKWTAEEHEALLRHLDTYGWDPQAIAAQLPGKQLHRVLTRMEALSKGASGSELGPRVQAWKQQSGGRMSRKSALWSTQDTLALLQGIVENGRAWSAIQRDCLPHLTVRQVEGKGTRLLQQAAGRSVEEMLLEAQKQQQQQLQKRLQQQGGTAYTRWSTEDTLALLQGITEYGTAWAAIQWACLPHMTASAVASKGRSLLQHAGGRSVEEMLHAVRQRQQQEQEQEQRQQQQQENAQGGAEACSQPKFWPKEDTLALLHGIAQHGTDWAAIQRECLPHLAVRRVKNKGAYMVTRASEEDVRSALRLRSTGAPGSGSVGEQYVLGVLAAGGMKLASRKGSRWAAEEQEALLQALDTYGWDHNAVAAQLPGRGPHQVLNRMHRMCKGPAASELRARVKVWRQKAAQRQPAAAGSAVAPEAFLPEEGAAEEEGGAEASNMNRRWPKEDILALLQGIAKHGTAWAAIHEECLPHLTARRVAAKGRYLVKISSVKEIREAVQRGGEEGAGGVGLQYVQQVLAAEEWQPVVMRHRFWTAKEKEVLLRGLDTYGWDFKAIAAHLPDKRPNQVLNRMAAMCAGASGRAMRPQILAWKQQAAQRKLQAAASQAPSPEDDSRGAPSVAQTAAGQGVAADAPQVQAASKRAPRKKAAGTATAARRSKQSGAAAGDNRKKAVTGLGSWSEEERQAVEKGFALYGLRYSRIAQELVPTKDELKVRWYMLHQQHKAIKAAFHSLEYAPLVQQRVEQDLEAAREALASQANEAGEGGGASGTQVWTARWSLQQHLSFLQGAAAHGLLNAAAIRLSHLAALSSEVVAAHSRNYARHLASLLLPPGLIPFSTPPASTPPAPTPTPRPPRSRRTPKPPPAPLTPPAILAQVQQIEELVTRLNANAQHLSRALSPPPSSPPLPPDLRSEIEAEMRHARVILQAAHDLLRTPPFLPFASTIPSLLPGTDAQPHDNEEVEVTASQHHHPPSSPPPVAAAAADQQGHQQQQQQEQQQLSSAATTAARRTPATAAAKASAAAAQVAPPPPPLARPHGPQQPGPGLKPRSIPSRGPAWKAATAMGKVAAAARRSAVSRMGEPGL